MEQCSGLYSPRSPTLLAQELRQLRKRRGVAGIDRRKEESILIVFTPLRASDGLRSPLLAPIGPRYLSLRSEVPDCPDKPWS